MTQDNSFLGTRQVLLVGLGGVGGRIVNNIMGKIPDDIKRYTQAIAIDTDINDMRDLDNIPRSNKITLACSPQSGNAMTIGSYIQKNPRSAEWFVTEGAAFRTLMGQSTKQGAKQIRMVSRLALSATAKYYNLENRITNIVNKLSENDGAVNRDGLLVMIVCSIAGGTGAGTVLQFPMFLEDIITRHFDPSAVSIQGAILLPNLFNQTQAQGNFIKGQVNGYAVLRELQSLNTGKLKRFEYMRDYVEVDETDHRNKTPYSFVLLFDNATSSGGTINGSTDLKHVPNIADCLYEYIYGPSAHKVTSQLDNTLDVVYSSGNTALYRAIGKASLIYPDNIYKQYAVSKWILTSISTDWLLPDEQAHKGYLELLKDRRDKGQERPGPEAKHQLFVKALLNKDVCKGQFYTEVRHQLFTTVGVKTKRLADVFFENVENKAIDTLNNSSGKGRDRNRAQGSASYATAFNNLSRTLQSKSNDTRDESFDALERAFNSYMEDMGNYVDSVMCPAKSLSARFLTKEDDDTSIFPFVRKHNLHPLAFKCFLYQLEEILEAKKNKAPADVKREEIVHNAQSTRNNSKKAQIVHADMDKLAKSYHDKLTIDIAKRMSVFVKELIVEIEALFEDIKTIKLRFESISEGCLKNLDSFDNETRTMVGSRHGMIACWNDIKSTLREGDYADEDAVDSEISVEIDKMVYTSYFKWVSNNSENTEEDESTVFRPRTNYASLVSEHLLRNFYKRISEGHSRSFPQTLVQAAIYEAYAQKAYDEQSESNPKFKPENFSFSVGRAETMYEQDRETPSAAAEYLNKKLVNIVKKSEPLSGPLCSKEANRDYLSRLLYFNSDNLSKTTEADPDTESGIRNKVEENEFIPGVSTSAIDMFNVQIEHLNGINRYQITCFSYTGGLELSDFENLQDPSSGTYDMNDGRCYYNAYRDYINAVMNTTKENITPHLHKDWHLAGYLNDITDDHTDSVLYHAAKAFVYGFLFDDIIRVTGEGYFKIGLMSDPVFADMPGSLDGVIERHPLEGAEHARFDSTSKNATNRILYDIFQYLRDMPELRTRVISYGDKLLEKAKANKTGAVFVYSLSEEICADVSYKTIIDVLDGFYQHARFTDLHDAMNHDKKILGYMFKVLCDLTIDVCASIFSSPKDRINAYNAYVEKLYTEAICDDSATPSGDTVSGDAGDIYLRMITTDTVDTDTSSDSKPFSNKGNFSKEAMKSRMEAYLNKTN